MIGKSTYKAAAAVAKAVEAHFVLHREDALQHGEENLAPQPSASVIETMLDVAFWASLRKEEGRSPQISLAFMPPQQAVQPLLFEKRLPFTPHTLTKIGPGVERPGIHLGIWFEKETLYLWGTTRQLQPVCFVLNVPEPGLLVIKHKRIGGFGKFINVAVLKGDQVKIVDENTAKIPDCPVMLTSLVGFGGGAAWNNSINILVQLAVSMRAHGRGGTLLIVPANSGTWRDSIIQPISYALAPAFSGLAEQMQQDINQRDLNTWQGALRREVEATAGLTALDGAAIMNDRYELLAFGAKIKRLQESETVEKMILTEPIVGNVAKIVNPAQHGGTRHLSAAQFVYDQRDALALVASQDGRFTIFAWSPCEEMVHAHRIDTLLL